MNRCWLTASFYPICRSPSTFRQPSQHARGGARLAREPAMWSVSRRIVLIVILVVTIVGLRGRAAHGIEKRLGGDTDGAGAARGIQHRAIGRHDDRALAMRGGQPAQD